MHKDTGFRSSDRQFCHYCGGKLREIYKHSGGVALTCARCRQALEGALTSEFTQIVSGREHAPGVINRLESFLFVHRDRDSDGWLHTVVLEHEALFWSSAGNHEQAIAILRRRELLGFLTAADACHFCLAMSSVLAAAGESRTAFAVISNGLNALRNQIDTCSLMDMIEGYLELAATIEIAVDDSVRASILSGALWAGICVGCAEVDCTNLLSLVRRIRAASERLAYPAGDPS